MALILKEKYTGKNSSYKLFITNRFLRIFPVYWTILLLTFFFILAKFFFHIGEPDNAIQHYVTYYAFTSHSVFVFDVINFISRNITLIFTTDYFFVHPETSGYLLVQQAWTLQTELLFYLIAPFIIRLNKKSFGILVIIYLLIFYGVIIKSLFLDHLTITYQFINSFIYFLLGIFSYYVYKMIKDKMISNYYLILVFGFSIFLLFIYNSISPYIQITSFYIPNTLYYVCFTGILPFIFKLTKSIKTDRFIGEISYPVYISHMFFIKLIRNIAFLKNSQWFVSIVIITTLAASVILALSIDYPIDKIRQRRLKKKISYFAV